MKINRMLSISLCIVMCLLGLVVGVTVAWLPSLLLSILGIGPSFLALMGILGAGAGFIAYTKACKKLNCWPLYTPPRNGLQQALDWVYPQPEDSIYEDIKEVIQKIEKEIAHAYSQGWENFNIEFSKKSDPLSNSNNHLSLLNKMIEGPLTTVIPKKHKRK